MLSARRVLARYLQADAVGDPKALLARFEATVNHIGTYEDAARRLQDLLGELEKVQDDPAAFAPLRTEWNSQRDAVRIKVAIEQGFKMMSPIGERLFLAILQLYALPPNLTKKVQAAARFWSKSRMTLRKDTRPWAKYLSYSEAVEAYPKVLSTYREQVAVATEAIEKGKPHGEEETPKVKAGPFTLVNTGNFPADVMDKVAEQVEKAAKAMTSAGFGKVCYGDIMVTNTITSQGNVMAFYMLANDEMFVRANVKPGWDTVRTICHELAHRLQNKFLAGKKREIDRLYMQIGSEKVDPATLPWPELGQEVVYKGETLKVLDVSRYSNRIRFGLPPGPEAPRGISFSTNIEGWNHNFGDKDQAVKTHRFVSEYAKKGGPNENFAEMVSFYALGKLPAEQIPLLEAVIQ